jgi:high-affinity iron transporter
MAQTYLRLILIGVVAPATLWAQTPTDAVRRIATTSRLAAEEYALGVVDGKIVLAPEVEEARLFFGEAKKSVAALPPAPRVRADATIDSLLAIIDRLGPADSLKGVVERMIAGLSAELGVTLAERPDAPPSLVRGEAIYRSTCSSCHGARGAGDGPLGAALAPKPANLADRTALAGSSPLDFYRRVTIGVAGTAMPSYEGTLSAADRWAVAAYASTLRLPAPAGTVPVALRDPTATASLSDAALLDSLGAPDLAVVAAIRSASGGPVDYGAVFAAVRRRLDSASQLAGENDFAAARSAALDAYMSFEAVERELRIKDATLVGRLEVAFAAMRDYTDDPGKLAAAREELARALDRAERTVGGTMTPVAVFAQSALILLREGLEAILVVGALIAVLGKLGAGHRRREIHLGVAAAVIASLLTAVAIETVFRMSPAHQEALEGLTMVLATAMLFSVSYWLVSKMEGHRWNQFVKSRLSDALSRRSMVALASVAFLAVYREGFETVLFYKALAVSAGVGGAGLGGPLAAGIGVAAVALAAIYVAINRFGVRLPLKPFFAVTSGFLYIMAFVFAGKAIAELQEAGFVTSTALAWMGRLPMFGIYPTLESTLAQAVIVALAAVALVWTFVVAPRRRAPHRIGPVPVDRAA